jgi:hypothetical protein
MWPLLLLAVSVSAPRSIPLQGSPRSWADRGITITLRASAPHVSLWRHRLEVAPSGDPAKSRELVIDTRARDLERVQVLTGGKAVIIGTEPSGVPVLLLLSVDTLVVELNSSCATLELDGNERRYLCLPASPEEAGLQVDADTGDVQTVTPLEIKVLRLLKSSSLNDRAAAVRAAMENRELVQQPALRNRLLGELTWVAAQDRQDAAAAPGAKFRTGTPLRDYLGALAEFEGRALDARALPLLASTDDPAVRNLFQFGEAAIPYVLRHWREPTPVGYSERYRPTLFETFRRIARNVKLAPGFRVQVAEAALEVLRSRQTAARLVQEALLLGEELDLNDFDPFFTKLATDEAAIRALGLDAPGDIQLVRQTASGILSRRVVIRDSSH